MLGMDLAQALAMVDGLACIKAMKILARAFRLNG